MTHLAGESRSAGSARFVAHCFICIDYEYGIGGYFAAHKDFVQPDKPHRSLNRLKEIMCVMTSCSHLAGRGLFQAIKGALKFIVSFWHNVKGRS